MRVVDIVSNILQTSKDARNSDKDLLIKFMESYGICLNDTQRSIFRNMPSLETARRIRQKLQQEGKYLADEIIGTSRRFRGYSMQQRAPQTTAHDVEKILERKAIPWLDD